jgi:hypothetical protein
MLSIFLISINTLSIIVLALYQHKLSNNIYEIRARLLELELKDLNKKQATLHRIR